MIVDFRGIEKIVVVKTTIKEFDTDKIRLDRKANQLGIVPIRCKSLELFRIVM